MQENSWAVLWFSNIIAFFAQPNGWAFFVRVILKATSRKNTAPTDKKSCGLTVYTDDRVLNKETKYGFKRNT